MSHPIAVHLEDDRGVADADLPAVIEDALASAGRPGRCVAVERRPNPYASTARIDDLDVTLHDGTVLAVVLKYHGAQWQIARSRRIRPRFLNDPRREVETYRRLLEPDRISAPRFYGGVERDEDGSCLMLLERVDGPLLWQVGEFETWRRAARWLARLHARYTDGQRLAWAARAARLLPYDVAYYSAWAPRAVEFLEARAGEVCATDRRRFRRLAEGYGQAVRRLLAMPRTFIHGEFYPSNIIITVRDGRTSCVCPVDWELASVGPGLMDLADLTSGGGWEAEQKEALVADYRQALSPGAAAGDFVRDLDLCRLHRAVQWLGWSRAWDPPRAHCQDWLAEAIRLGERLGM
jgi:aminoglycoside phosphotransferase (APT) family kinase protein